MKQLGKGEDQYSQAAYQGYVNNMNAPKPKPSGGSNPRPLPVAQPPLQTNQSPQIKQLSGAVESLQVQIKKQADDGAAQIAKNAAEQKAEEAKKPRDVSKALNSTLLTGTAGVQEKKKKQNFLQPIGG